MERNYHNNFLGQIYNNIFLIVLWEPLLIGLKYSLHTYIKAFRIILNFKYV